MIYTTGTISVNGNTATGTGTSWTAAGTLIRNGCTVIVFSSPVQVFQITAINDGTTLSVSPAASPALTGQKYAILLSDSLSVDGLAQDIAETFGMYQRNISGFGDVMNGSGDVTITVDGKTVTVPGQQSLAKKGPNSDITSLSGLTTALSISQGGTGGNTAAAARTALGLDTAATRAVGAASNDQIPDMSSQTKGLGTNLGWQKFPNGLIRQWGLSAGVSGSGGNASIAFPIQFPNECLQLRCMPVSEGVPAVSLFMQSGLSRTGAVVWGVGRITASGPALGAIPSGTQTYWEAWGY